jgi:hypothetical protein
MACPPQVPISVIPPVGVGVGPLVYANGNQVARLNPPLNPSFVVYDGSVTRWGDGSSNAPVLLPNLQQVSQSTINFAVGLNTQGQLAAYANTTVDPNNALVTATGSTTPRTLANRFADVVNVKDFGATGDGVTDDTTAIQAALNSLIPNGGVLFFPQGTYLITSSLNVPSMVNLYGEGKQISKILTNNSINLLSFSNENTYGTFIEYLWLYGNGSSNGIYCDATTELDAHVLIRDCRFENHSNGITNGSGNYALFDSLLEKCDFLNCNVGVVFSGSQITCLECTFRLNNYGCELNYESAGSVAGVRFYGCTWISNTYDVVTNGSIIRPTLFSGCWFEQSKNYVVGTLTSGTQYHQTTTFVSCIFQPGSTSIGGGVWGLNNTIGIISFDACVVDASLYSSSTLPNTSDARFLSSCIYSRKDCNIINSGVLTILSNGTTVSINNYRNVFINEKYANDSLAGAGGLVQGDMYYNTTTGSLSLKN